jgi:hypothetical protein
MAQDSSNYYREEKNTGQINGPLSSLVSTVKKSIKVSDKKTKNIED